MVTILARSKQALSSFNLDFGGESLGSVSGQRQVRELDARRRRARDHPAAPAGEASPLRRAGLGLRRRAHRAQLDDPTSTAFFITPHGTATAPQPDLAHLIFPSNDHPSDKASYTFRFDVPAGIVAVANGVPTGRRSATGARAGATCSASRWRPSCCSWRSAYDLLWAGRHRGVPIRNVIAPTLREVGDPAVALTRAPRLDDRARGPLSVRHLRLADRRRRAWLRARDPDDLALRQGLVHRVRPGHVGAHDGPRALARVVRQQRLAGRRGATCG